MACNCKAKKQMEEVSNILPTSLIDESYEKKNLTFYFLLVLNYSILILKMTIISLSVLLITPFVSLFVIWGFITKRKVTVKIPKKFIDK